MSGSATTSAQDEETSSHSSLSTPSKRKREVETSNDDHKKKKKRKPMDDPPLEYGVWRIVAHNPSKAAKIYPKVIHYLEDPARVGTIVPKMNVMRAICEPNEVPKKYNNMCWYWSGNASPILPSGVRAPVRRLLSFQQAKGAEIFFRYFDDTTLPDVLESAALATPDYQALPSYSNRLVLLATAAEKMSTEVAKPTSLKCTTDAKLEQSTGLSGGTTSFSLFPPALPVGYHSVLVSSHEAPVLPSHRLSMHGDPLPRSMSSLSLPPPVAKSQHQPQQSILVAARSRPSFEKCRTSFLAGLEHLRCGVSTHMRELLAKDTWDWPVIGLLLRFAGIHHPIVVLSGNLTDQERAALTNAVVQLKGEVRDPETTQDYTHCVIPRGRRSRRSLLTTLKGKWVVTPDWITDSARMGRWLSESDAPFLMSAISNGYGSQMYGFRHEPGLWRGKSFVLSPEWCELQDPRRISLVKELIVTAGGTVKSMFEHDRSPADYQLSVKGGSVATGQCRHITWGDFRNLIPNSANAFDDDDALSRFPAMSRPVSPQPPSHSVVAVRPTHLHTSPVFSPDLKPLERHIDMYVSVHPPPEWITKLRAKKPRQLQALYQRVLGAAAAAHGCPTHDAIVSAIRSTVYFETYPERNIVVALLSLNVIAVPMFTCPPGRWFVPFFFSHCI